MSAEDVVVFMALSFVAGGLTAMVLFAWLDSRLDKKRPRRSES